MMCTQRRRDREADVQPDQEVASAHISLAISC
jgi:hypothetical protein